MNTPSPDYLLGNTDEEHQRLIRQAKRIAPITESFFREAGIGPGQRVLDLGSGVGDVAMLAAKLVGPSGEVVGVERDTRSIARAIRRAADAGYHNVTFRQTDVAQISSYKPFDAVVGRYILQFLPDPVGVVRSLSKLLNPGGVVAFQEPCWVPFLQLCRDLPLWSAGASLIYETSHRAGVNMRMGLTLHKVFQEAGLPAPKMHMEVPLGNDPDFTRWIPDVLCAVRPQIEQFRLSLDAVGDLDTLPARLQKEVAASHSVVPWFGIVGAWSRTGTT
ncbi:MAG: methylase [Candidatus Eremiobacter antarcticus]|nr:class I SAM-dependent methyltransferase [Candidatus Eremiobacteraeota bacterium]PZR60263.1 MAG: methylase [Candidatus Eremiobacter sp. RRmetagenome_bin22]